MKLKRPQLLKVHSAKTVSFGKNDGKFDDIDRYFLDTGIIDQIYRGDRCIIVGRKGTGKTALAYYIKKNADRSYDKFASILSFKDVPVVLLEQFNDKAHRLSNKYIVLWKYIFLIELSKLLLKDESILDQDKNKLSVFIDLNFPSLKGSPREYLKETVERSFKVDLHLVGGGVKATSEDGVVNLLPFINSLQEITRRVAAISNSYIIFIDEMDDIYEDRAEYYDILVGMFKAGMELNAYFKQEHKPLRVAMLIRDDIYRNAQYSDKNKWSDMTFNLDWIPDPKQMAFETSLFGLINLRIGASLVDSPQLDENYWSELFAAGFVKADIKPFQYILSRSYYRPRDIIQFCKEAQNRAIKAGERLISGKSVLAAEFAYSEWFLEEVRDEIKPRIPFISDIFEAFKRHGHDKFTAQDINTQLQKFGVVTQMPTRAVLEILFDFSVIGMFIEEHGHTPVFKYRDPNIDFEERRRYSVHFGLRPALKLREPHAGAPAVRTSGYRRRGRFGSKSK